MTSVPSLKVTPATTLGNWFSPFNRRQVFEAAIIVPPRSTAVPSETAETVRTQHDRHLHLIRERGRMSWQKASGYNRRALVEAMIGRFKRVIGDALRFRTDQRQETEVAIAILVLNRMLELGCPTSVRIA